MGIEAAIYSRATTHAGLAALIGTRCHPEVLPQQSVLPAITYQRISTPRRHTMGVVPPMAHPRFQFDCFAATYLDVTTLAAQVRAAFSRWSGTVGGVEVLDARLDNEIDHPPALLGTSTEMRRVSLDFIIDHRE